MKKITVHVTTGVQGADRETEIEVEDDAAEEQIEEDAKDAMFAMIEWSWWPFDPARRRR